MKRSKLAQVATYAPHRIVTNEEIQRRVNKKNSLLEDGVLKKLFGISERRFAESGEQVSDLAVKAASEIVEEVGRENIDFLIFAAACSDLIEPATSNIIQNKLGLTCPCMDIKNACNSMVSAIHTADAFIKAGAYKNILIVNGEKLSDAINFDVQNHEHLLKSLPAYTLGDAGSAVLIQEAGEDEGIFHQEFLTVGKHWDLCTIQGGGSMYPRDVSKLYFEGKTAELKDAIVTNSRSFINSTLDKFGWERESIDHVFTHQVSKNTFKVVAEKTNLNLAKFVSTFENFGNTAAASIPLAIRCAQERNELKKGNKILVLGLAAGLSVSVQLMIW